LVIEEFELSGFVGIAWRDKNFNKSVLDGIEKNSRNFEKFVCDSFYVLLKRKMKFYKDIIFFETQRCFFLIEGVILNSLELIKKYKSESFGETIALMHEKNGDVFFKEFRGSFAGMTYWKNTHKLILYTDHIGSKQIFFSLKDRNLIFSSNGNRLVNLLRKFQIDISLNIDSAYSLLTFGYMLESHTIFNEIEKLMGGHYLEYLDGQVQIVQYYRLSNVPDNKITENDAVERLDMLFKKAVTRAFEKDLEYGYRHLVALSGGLDSRMTTWVAHDLGYSSRIVNFTFSQTNYFDETIAKRIATDLRHEWIFKSLDNGLFLRNVEDIVRLTFGGVLYCGSAHFKSMLDLLNLESFGLIHTGQLGDVIVGTYYSSPRPNKPYSISSGAYSFSPLSAKISKDYIKYDYENEEIFKFYNRGFSGMNSGLMLAQEKTETYSPFYDVDVMDFCLSLPLRFRFGHRLYIKWILSKYPGASHYVWEKIKTKPSVLMVNILGKRVPVRKLLPKVIELILRKIGLLKDNINTKKHMNPFGFWYNTNEDLKMFFDDYFIKNIDFLGDFPELMNDCKNLWENGLVVDRCQVITLLAIMKVYFG